MTSTTKDIVDHFASLPEDQRQGIIADALAATSSLKWLPVPGPQTMAYFSEANILLYGGKAGGSKTDSSLGLASNEHKNSLLCRRQYTDLSAMIKRALEINDTRDGFKGAERATGRTRDGKLRFTNKMTEAYWRPREILDPDQPIGSPIALLPDQKPAGQLCAVAIQRKVAARNAGVAEERRIVFRIAKTWALSSSMATTSMVTA